MRNEKNALFYCPSEDGFDAADGFCHLVIADRAWTFYTSGFRKLQLEDYLICVLGDAGYRSVVYRSYPEPDLREVLGAEQKVALVILPDDWGNFSDWAFGRMENGSIRMKYLRQADKERRLLLVFAAVPGMYIPEQTPGTELEKLIHIWRPEQLAVQSQRKEWHGYLCGTRAEAPMVQEILSEEIVQITEEEVTLFQNMKAWSDHLRHDSYALFERNADILRRQLIYIEELYQVEIQRRKLLWNGSSAEELKAVSELKDGNLDPEQKKRVLRVMEEADRREQLSLRQAICMKNLQKMRDELTRNSGGGSTL